MRLGVPRIIDEDETKKPTIRKGRFRYRSPVTTPVLQVVRPDFATGSTHPNVNFLALDRLIFNNALNDHRTYPRVKGYRWTVRKSASASRPLPTHRTPQGNAVSTHRMSESEFANTSRRHGVSVSSDCNSSNLTSRSEYT